MSWGAIKLRYRDSKNVFFDGEASPAPGGGSMPQPSVVAWVAKVACGDGPNTHAVSPTGNVAVVCNTNTDTVTVIDLRTLEVLGTVTVGNTPIWAGITPDGATAVVSNFGDGTTSIIDLASLTVTHTVADAYCFYGAISPDGATAYLADGTNLYFVDIAAGTIAQTVALANGYWTAVSPDGATLAVGADSGTDVFIVDVATHTITHTVSVAATGPVDTVAFTVDDAQIWAACGADGAVVVVDRASGAIVDTVTFAGGYIYDVEPSSDGSVMVAADSGAYGGNDKAYVIRVPDRSLLATLDCDYATFVSFTADSRTVFVTGNVVAVIDLTQDPPTLAQTLAEIPASTYGNGMGVLPTPDGTKITLTDGQSPVGGLLIGERLLTL